MTEVPSTFGLVNFLLATGHTQCGMWPIVPKFGVYFQKLAPLTMFLEKRSVAFYYGILRLKKRKKKVY